MQRYTSLTSSTTNLKCFSHIFNENQIMIDDYDGFSNVTLTGLDRSEAITVKKRLIENEKIRNKIDDEIETIRHLILEGGKFTITRKQYLDILYSLRGKGI